MRLRPFLLLVLALLLTAQGCTFVKLTPPPLSGTVTRFDDASIKTDIISALLKKNAAKANSINVRSHRGHVFLIGEADAAFRKTAVDTATQTEGVVHVTTHWFPPGTASTRLDSGIEEAIDRKLFFSEEASMRRLAIDVWGGHVVLTGVAATQEDIDKAVTEIRALPNVKSVTCYVSLRSTTA